MQITPASSPANSPAVSPQRLLINKEAELQRASIPIRFKMETQQIQQEMGNGVDGKAIMQMFTSLQPSINAAQVEIAQTNASLESKIQGIILLQNKDDDRIIELGKKQECTEDKRNYLMGVVMRQEKMISSLNGRIVEMEHRCSVNNVIVSGIQQKKDENCAMEVQHFFRSKLKLTQYMPMKDARRMGKKEGKDKPMVIDLQEISKKGMIHKNVYRL